MSFSFIERAWDNYVFVPFSVFICFLYLSFLFSHHGNYLTQTQAIASSFEDTGHVEALSD